MIPIDKDKVASRIALIRKELGLTMKDFGWKVDGVDKSTVSNWEKGKTMPSLKHLELIAEAGKRDVGWLQHGTMESYLPKLIEQASVPGSRSRRPWQPICSNSAMCCPAAARSSVRRGGSSTVDT